MPTRNLRRSATKRPGPPLEEAHNNTAKVQNNTNTPQNPLPEKHPKNLKNNSKTPTASTSNSNSTLKFIKKPNYLEFYTPAHLKDLQDPKGQNS